MTGWISLHRSITDHWLFEEERKFSRFEAWIDLLLMVNHTDNKIIHGGELITVKRGQRITSLRKLSDRWNWSITKTDKFLNTLEIDEMIRLEKDTKKTLITIVNYEFYQNENIKKRHQKDNENTQKENGKKTEKNQKETNNNDNNFNNENNVVDDDYKTIFNLYQQNIEMTPSQITIQKISDDFDRYGEKLMKFAIEKSAINNNHNYRFIDFLLKDWRKNQLTTIEAVKQYEDHKANKPNQYASKYKGQPKEEYHSPYHDMEFVTPDENDLPF